jgi:hypothetical protein
VLKIELKIHHYIQETPNVKDLVADDQQENIKNTLDNQHSSVNVLKKKKGKKYICRIHIHKIKICI